MFERYTGPARRVVHIAEGLAQADKSPQAVTGHLLLGFLYENGCTAWQALTALHLTTSAVRDAVCAAIRDVPPGAWGHNQPLSPRLHTVLQDATGEALKLGCTYVGTEHLLLAVVRDRDPADAAPRGTALDALEQLGVEAAAVRAAVMQILTGRGTEHPVSMDGEDVPVSERNPEDVETEILLRLGRIERVLEMHVGQSQETRRKLGLA